MLCKFYIKIGSIHFDEGGSVDITSELTNISEIRMTYMRSGLDSMLRKCTSELKLCGSACDLVMAEYKTNYLSAKACVAVYTIDDSWVYNKVWQCPLDFTTLTFNKNYLSINCLDNSAASLIKAQKSVKFEYPVSELKDSTSLVYDGVKMKKKCEFFISGETVSGQTYMKIDIQANWWWIPQLQYVDNDIDSKDITVKDQNQVFSDGTGGVDPQNNITTSFFLECINPCMAHVDLSTIYFNKLVGTWWWGIYRIRNGSVALLTSTWYEFGRVNSKLSDMKGDFLLEAGDKLQLAARRDIRQKDEARVANAHGFAEWKERTDAITIDAIKPVKLLNKVLESISNADQEIHGAIKDTIRTYDAETDTYTEEPNERLSNTIIVAGESVRGVKDAKISTSFNDFCKYMESVFGYVPKISYTGVSSSDQREKILDCADFVGFTTFKWNVSSLDVLYDIYFSTTDGAFVNIPPSTVHIFSKSHFFPGSEQYQESDVRTDVVFRDTTNYKCYYATVTPPVSAGYPSRATLNEYKLTDIYGPDFSGKAEFGSIIDSIEETDIEETYEGDVSISNVVYVRKLHRFYYHSSDKYYKNFDNDSIYNLNDNARIDVVFMLSTSMYIVVGLSLVEYIGDMPAFGVPDSGMDDEKTALVTFIHRNEAFNEKVVKTINVYQDPEYKINESRIYSQVKIGYEKRDYDDVNNGFDEFNFTNIYSTGVNLNDNTLDLTCPYRADCYGFEQLAEKRGKDSSSTDSDSSIFIVNTDVGRDGYIVNRNASIENAYTDSVFNGYLSPMSMVEANKEYLGMFANLLTFASAEGNSNIIIDGQKMSDNISISNRIFGCGDITISTNDLSVPGFTDGLIEFEWNGTTYQGYIKSVEANFRKSEILKYELIER